MVSKHDILDAAFGLFCQRGYSLSMADIAHIVGLKTPSLYSHFSGKDEIVEEMIRGEVGRFYSVLGGCIDSAAAQPANLGIKLIFATVIEYFCEYNRLRFWRSIPLIPNEHLRSCFAQIITERDSVTTAKMKQLFSDAIGRGEITPSAGDGSIFLFTAMIQGVLDGMLLYAAGQGQVFFAEQVFDAFWSGICTDSGRTAFRSGQEEPVC